MLSDSDSEAGENPLTHIVRDIQSSSASENGEDTEKEEVQEKNKKKKVQHRIEKGDGAEKTIHDIKSPFDKILPDEPGKRDLKSGLSVVLMEELIKRLYEFKEEANDVLEEFLTFEGMWSGRSYPRFFTKIGIVTPITYFKGASSANVDWFYNDFYEKINDIKHHKEELSRKFKKFQILSNISKRFSKIMQNTRKMRNILPATRTKTVQEIPDPQEIPAAATRRVARRCHP